MTHTLTSSSAPVAGSRSKLVIRRLPPSLPEDTFWTSVSSWINGETCLWKRYIKGRAGEGYDAHPVHSRAYCLMSSPEALIAFHRAFDGHVFRSKTGRVYQAVVEYAPLQKTPYKAKVKVDTRQGTIDDDPDYLSFLESLNAPTTKTTPEVSAPPPNASITPLIEHLRAIKSGKAQVKAAAKPAQASNEDARRSAALASVNKASTRREAQAQSGPLMLAGKGRDVVITPIGGTDIGGGLSGGLKKKGKRDRTKSPARPGQPPALSGSVGPSGPSLLTPAASQTSTKTRGPNPGSTASDRGAAGSRGGRGGRGRGRGDGHEVRGRGDGSQMGRARGRGGGEKERTAHGAVMQILTKNSDVERGRGRGKGTGGMGSSTSDAGAKEARIDMQP